MNVLEKFFGKKAAAELVATTIAHVTPPAPDVRVLNVSALGGMQAPTTFGFDDGSRFSGGLGPIEVNTPDMYALRARSSQFFEEVPAARGIVRRLVTNIIATGLHLEAIPNEALLGLGDEALADWTEDVENRFETWASCAYLCDATGQQDWGALQASIFTEALVGGDCLISIAIARDSQTPKITITPGHAIVSPMLGQQPDNGNTIDQGVERDAQNRHVAYWVRQKDMTVKRVPAWGEKSGRRIAWLVYGTDKRISDVRGRPLLSIVLQALSEIDRYKNSTLRKAFVNSLLSMWVEKTEDKFGSSALGNMAIGAMRADVSPDQDPTLTPRTFDMRQHLPGLVIQELQTGEKIHAHSSAGVTDSYHEFEDAIYQGIAWGLEIPPEILMLRFSANYSASKAALNEFEVFIFKQRTWFGSQVCSPIYVEWLLSEVLAGRVKADGLLEAWRDPAQYVTLGAWIASDWSGHVKPSVDPVKQMKGFNMMVESGAATRDRVSRWTSGMKFSRVVKQLRRENEMLAEAMRPIVELMKPPGDSAPGEPDDFVEGKEDD